MPRLAVIADDLTGATDTGLQFAKYGLQTYVFIAAAGSEFLPHKADVVVIDTNSRGLDPQAAYQQAVKAAVLLKQMDAPIIYKKVDSTLRGNIGAEIDAVLDVFGFDCAIVAPAFPRIGRITVGGYHLLNQKPLQATELAHDPKTPVTDSQLPAVLKRQSRYETAHIELSVILAGEPVICQLLDQYMADGVKVISFDATDEQHLRTIAQAVYRWGKHILWAGSAGMAEYLPALYQLPAEYACPVQPGKDLPVVVVAGSMSKVTAGQIDRFLARPGTALVSVSGSKLIEQPDEEIRRCVGAAGEYIRQRQDVAITLSHGCESLAIVRSLGERRGMDAKSVSDLVAKKLGQITQMLIDDTVEGLLLTGGDTAVQVCAALGASSMEVCAEIAPGIPLCRLRSGKHDGLKVVTKAGAFGDDQAINNAVAAIRCSKEMWL